MKRYSNLHKYSINEQNKPEFLDLVATEFKHKVIESIREKFLDVNIKKDSTKSKLLKNFDKQILVEYNSVKIPYFNILENINLCVEVEMSQDQILTESINKFGEVKFSDILTNGMKSVSPIKRFAISDKRFLDSLLSEITNYTDNFEVDGDTIKIEFD